MKKGREIGWLWVTPRGSRRLLLLRRVAVCAKSSRSPLFAFVAIVEVCLTVLFFPALIEALSRCNR